MSASPGKLQVYHPKYIFYSFQFRFITQKKKDSTFEHATKYQWKQIQTTLYTLMSEGSKVQEYTSTQ